VKILLAVDGSPYSRAAARYLARTFGAFSPPPRIELLHVHAPIPYPIAATAVGKKAVDDYQRETSLEALHVAEAELAKAGIAYSSSWRVGDVAAEIASYVRKNGIELVICGSHGHNAFVNLALGSVATRVVAMSPAPVLLVTREAVAAQRQKKAP
jgi:nucleotide-binding universal stress UspA family protein